MCDPNAIYLLLRKVCEPKGWEITRLGDDVTELTVPNGPRVVVTLRHDKPDLPLRASIFSHFNDPDRIQTLALLGIPVVKANSQGWCISYELSDEDLLSLAVTAGVGIMQAIAP